MKRLFGGLVALALTAGAAWAEECTYENDPPEMPDPATATAEDRSEAITSIKDYQESLNGYRACLDVIIKNTELERETRQAALDKFNATVDWETAIVEKWQAFDAAYQDAQDG